MKLLSPANKAFPIIVLCITLFIGCAKTDDVLEPIKPPIETPPTANDAVRVAATVTGSVIDENNQPVANAAVTAGTASTTTDAMGNFSFRNIVLSALNGNVTVNKTGYFKGIRNFTTESGKNNYVKIQLIKQTLTGTVPAAAGGSITVSGSIITFPASAFETTAGAPYTGNVNVYAAWIDPTAANLPLVIPGDLRGLNSSNGEYLLKSYGMVGAELKDDNGNALKIATGKTASVSFPIPASLQSTAPATIPLWHFDEITNRWREEGTATKTGNNYVGQVNKFSFWNVDVPANFVNLEMRLLNSTNNLPLANTMVKVTSLATNTYAYDYTNDSGYVSGFVPKNENLKIEVLASTTCNTNTVVYTQNVGPYTTNTSLGDILVTIPPNLVINFTGTVKGCNNQPVSNGYVSLSLANGTSTIAYTNASGAVNFSLIYCGGTTQYTYNAVDLTNGNYSNTATGTATTNTVNLGTIAACGNTINLSGVYIAGYIDDRAVLWKDGVPTFLTGPATNGGRYVAYKVLVSNNDIYVLGFKEEDSTGRLAKVLLWKNGIETTIVSNITGGIVSLGFDVYNSDVYVTCLEDSSINGNRYWKNGIQQTLTNGTYSSVDVAKISIDNGVVYACGIGNIPNSNLHDIIYWTNSTISTVSTTPQYDMQVHDFKVANGNIYIVGRDSLNNVYWKNNIKTYLPLQNIYDYGFASSIFIDNNNTYIAGDQSNYNTSNYAPTYWLNNSVNTLANYNNGFVDIAGIFVKNNIVYTVGAIETPNNFQPLYFQNNIPVQLSGFNTSQEVGLGGIFVQ